MRIPGYAHETLDRAEQVAEHGSVEETLEVLRDLPLADFCALHFAVPAGYPNLRRTLPVNPPEDVQRKWVGDSGPALMARSCNVIRMLESLSFRVRGKEIRGGSILDYGCGWGRLLRLANHFSSVEQVRGVDVMQSSLDECERSRVPNEVALIDPEPNELPFGETRFDLIYSFSVFTHIPDHVARSVLRAARGRVAHDGLMALTIRSEEFWNLREGKWDDDLVARLRRDHRDKGYAFHTSSDPKYGDTTMSFEFLSGIAGETGWKLALVDRDLSEPFQISAALVPA